MQDLKITSDMTLAADGHGTATSRVVAYDKDIEMTEKDNNMSSEHTKYDSKLASDIEAAVTLLAGILDNSDEVDETITITKGYVVCRRRIGDRYVAHMCYYIEPLSLGRALTYIRSILSK